MAATTPIKPLDHHLSNILPKHWDYYYNNGRKIQNPFASNGGHQNFIEHYFKVAGKEVLLDSFPVRNLNRPEHVTSTFFLGLIIIAECDLSTNIGMDGKNLPGYNTLPFVWFLTTLFHDYAEGLENDTVYHQELKSVQDIMKKYSIEHNLLSKQIPGVNKVLFDSVSNYYKLRHTESKVDHGIHAALFAFDLLVKNRIKNKELATGQLSWEAYLDEQYALSCACVAIHNIWVNKDKSVYLEHNLNGLVSYEPYSIKDYPLPYIFSIVDTIDPIKYFCYNRNQKENVPLDVLLRSIGFTFHKTTLYIHNVSLSHEKFNSYFAKIKNNLKGWLCHEIRHVRQGEKIRLTML